MSFRLIRRSVYWGDPGARLSISWPSNLMLNGLHHVWRAAEILASADCGLRGRLKQARAEFVLSLNQPDQWPAELLPIARSIERSLRQKSDFDPVETMDLALAQQVAEDLLALAVDVLAAFSKEQEPGDKGHALGQDGGDQQTLRVLRVEPAQSGIESDPNPVSLP